VFSPQAAAAGPLDPQQLPAGCRPAGNQRWHAPPQSPGLSVLRPSRTRWGRLMKGLGLGRLRTLTPNVLFVATRVERPGDMNPCRHQQLPRFGAGRPTAITGRTGRQRLPSARCRLREGTCAIDDRHPPGLTSRCSQTTRRQPLLLAPVPSDGFLNRGSPVAGCLSDNALLSLR